MECSLPFSLSPPPITSSLLFPLSSPQPSYHIASYQYPEKKTKREEIKAQFNQDYSSLMQSFSPEEFPDKVIQGGSGFIITREFFKDSPFQFYYCSLHYHTEIDKQQYSVYRLLSTALSSNSNLFCQINCNHSPFYIMNCKQVISPPVKTICSDDMNNVAAMIMKNNWIEDIQQEYLKKNPMHQISFDISSIFQYELQLLALKQNNQLISPSNRM